MKKVVKIEGLKCVNCAARLEGMLNTVEGVSAKVDFDTKTADIDSAREIADDEIRNMVDFAGYKAVEIISFVS